MFYTVFNTGNSICKVRLDVNVLIYIWLRLDALIYALVDVFYTAKLAYEVRHLAIFETGEMNLTLHGIK